MHRNFSLMIHKKILTMYGGGLIDKLCSTLATPWTVSHQVPLSMGFSRQDYWNGLRLPSPGDLPNPGIKPWSPALQANSLPTEISGKPNNRATYRVFCFQLFFIYL